MWAPLALFCLDCGPPRIWTNENQALFMQFHAWRHPGAIFVFKMVCTPGVFFFFVLNVFTPEEARLSADEEARPWPTMRTEERVEETEEREAE